LVSIFSAYIFNHIYNTLSREHESVRDRFFRVLWIATLVRKLGSYPLPNHVQVLDELLQEAKNLNPDGSAKEPKKRKAPDTEEVQKKKAKK
jgi:hypothetical protein